DIILDFYDQAKEAVKEEAAAEEISKLEVTDEIARMKNISMEEFDDRSEEIRKKMKEQIESVK
ncbi:MAG: V-type ATP synthase subunit A, partial [Candidatus Nanohaloarchaea archaeon]